MKNLFLYASFLLLFTYCQYENTNNSQKDSIEMNIANKEMTSINLTVAEGKRLIAKGIANTPRVKEQLKEGLIIITRGTTNTYLAEELTHQSIPHGSFLTGHIVPSGMDKINKNVLQNKEIVIEKGKTMDIPYKEALKKLKPGNIVFKGGNLLNYSHQQAAVCIGAPDGGTTYSFLPYVGENKAELIVPIGLEKDLSQDLSIYEKILNSTITRKGFVPRLHLYKDATIFTEIEAIKQFADVEVFPWAKGGISGREGGISLAIIGSEKEINKVLSLIETIQGEPSF